MEELKNLNEFWCNDNQLNDWKNIELLGKLANLTVVYLERNPISADTMYRKKLMLICPKLTQIDATMCR